jgi:hypothetical protein
MNMNCLFLRKYLLVLVVLLGTLFPRTLQAQGGGWVPLMEIEGFGYEIDSAGFYHFYPICNGIHCSGVQETNYSYLWDFGQGRYSLEFMPAMKFDHHPPSSVSLRVTGLKTLQDPDARVPLIRPAESNCIPTDTFVGLVETSEGAVEHPRFQPQVEILHPSHMPVAGKCADYLVTFDFSQGCKYAGEFELIGFVESQNKPWVTIGSVENSPGITAEITAPDKVNIKIDKTQNRKLYLLLHCKFSAEAKPELTFHWTLKGKFKAGNPSSECKTFEVNESRQDKVQGSLDPSYLAPGTYSKVNNGTTMMWDIKVQNEGNAPESYIEIVDTLPMEFDWYSVKDLYVQWGGRDITPVRDLDTLNRCIKWILNNDAQPLLPGQYAQVQFNVRVDHAFKCPLVGGSKPDCVYEPWAGRNIKHRVWTKFHGEQLAGYPERWHKLEYNDLTVLCENACEIKPPVAVEAVQTPVRAWIPITITVLIAGTVIIYLLYLLAKAKRKRVRG